jgi:predicted transcriptional regulator
MSTSQVDLDANTLRALASQNRLCMLQLLKLNKMRLSDLSKTLDLPKSSTHKDLDILMKSGLVNKRSSSHKWCYYEPTRKGSKLFSDKPKKIIIVADAISDSVSHSAVKSISVPAGPPKQLLSGRKHPK